MFWLLLFVTHADVFCCQRQYNTIPRPRENTIHKPSIHHHPSSCHSRLVEDVETSQRTQCRRRLNVHRSCRSQHSHVLSHYLFLMPRCLSHVVVGAVYNPPSADDKKITTHILTCLDTVTHDHPQAGVIVHGDFNRLRDAALISYPLKQVVKAPTRKASVLDKIYTKIQDWYDQPVVLPNIGRSDHRAVLMSASVNPKREHGQEITVVRRSQDSNGMAQLA